mmetsp:Transcript_68747/g.139336  ORF Transcript_68747/g.139336 Transcript_68747/m.139336 type:complete len:227 (+) Transcript_68747:965-1645(+)
MRRYPPWTPPLVEPCPAQCWWEPCQGSIFAPFHAGPAPPSSAPASPFASALAWKGPWIAPIRHRFHHRLQRAAPPEHAQVDPPSPPSWRLRPLILQQPWVQMASALPLPWPSVAQVAPEQEVVAPLSLLPSPSPSDQPSPLPPPSAWEPPELPFPWPWAGPWVPASSAPPSDLPSAWQQPWLPPLAWPWAQLLRLWEPLSPWASPALSPAGMLPLLQRALRPLPSC